MLDIWKYRPFEEIIEPEERTRLHSYWSLVQAWKGREGREGESVTLGPWPPTDAEIQRCLEVYELPERVKCRACGAITEIGQVPVRDGLSGRLPLGPAPFCPKCLAVGWEALDEI